MTGWSSTKRTPNRSAKAVIAVTLLALLLVAAVPVALLAGVVMMLLGRVVERVAPVGFDPRRRHSCRGRRHERDAAPAQAGRRARLPSGAAGRQPVHRPREPEGSDYTDVVQLDRSEYTRSTLTCYADLKARNSMNQALAILGGLGQERVADLDALVSSTRCSGLAHPGPAAELLGGCKRSWRTQKDACGSLVNSMAATSASGGNVRHCPSTRSPMIVRLAASDGERGIFLVVVTKNSCST